MAEAIYLASTLVMGLLIVGVMALVLRGRKWFQYTPQAAYSKLSAGGSGPGSAVGRLANTEGAWMVAFFVLALGLMAGATVYVSGGASAVVGPALIGALGVVVVVYFVGGVYIAMRNHGRPTSQAVAGSAAAFGALFLLGLVVRLVLSG